MRMEIQSLPTNCPTSSNRFSFSCDGLSHNKPLPDMQDFSSPPDCSQSSVHAEMAMTETEESRMETDSSHEETESLPESEKQLSLQLPDTSMGIAELVPAPVTAQDEHSQQCGEEAETGITPIAPGEDMGPVPELVPDSDLLNSGKTSPSQRNKRKRTLEDIVRQMKESESPGEDSNDTFNEEDMLSRLDKSPGTDEPSELDSSISQSGETFTKDFTPTSMAEKLQSSGLLLPNLAQQAQMLASSMKDETALGQYIPPGILPSQINPYNLFPYNMNGLAPSPFLPNHMDQNSLVSKIFPMLGSPFGPTESEKDYLKCQYCERTFRRQKNLENHIENAHQGKGRTKRRSEGPQGDMYFKCTHCPYTTKHQSNLYVHLRIHTGERPYICGACGVQYSQSHSLKSHIINKHDGMMTYYIKEKRTRSPRGLGYLTTQSPQDIRFPLPNNSLLNVQQSPDLAPRNQDQNHQNRVKVEGTPDHLRNGHAPRQLSMSEKPTQNQNVSNNWQRDTFRNNIKEEVPKVPGVEAIDLTKKAGKDKLDEELNKTAALCFQNGNNNNCNHAWKLKALRRNVLRMLSILVPNLNFEEKGISADGDSIDELLQDVIESNTQEPVTDE